MIPSGWRRRPLRRGVRIVLLRRREPSSFPQKNTGPLPAQGYRSAHGRSRHSRTCKEALRRTDRVPEVGALAPVSARPHRSGGGVRGPVQRRQVVAPQCAHQPQVAGADLEHARPHAGAELLRGRKPDGAAAGRHARLRLRRGAQGFGEAVAFLGERLSARASGAEARARPHRLTPRREAGGPGGDGHAR